jgi:hypothetical protein
VKAARDRFLAGAGLADDQRVDIGMGHKEDEAADLLHQRRTSDEPRFDVVALMEAAAQTCDLQRQPAFFKRAPDDVDEVLGRKRLLDDIIGAAAHRLDRQRRIAMAGDHDDRQIGIEPLRELQELQPVRTRKPHVRHHDAGKIGLQHRFRTLGRSRRQDFDPGKLHGLLDPQPDIGIVFDDQHFGNRFSFGLHVSPRRARSGNG